MSASRDEWSPLREQVRRTASGMTAGQVRQFSERNALFADMGGPRGRVIHDEWAAIAAAMQSGRDHRPADKLGYYDPALDSRPL